MKLCQNKHCRKRTYHAICIVDTRHFDLGDKTNIWWVLRVVIAALNLQAVDAIFIRRLETERTRNGLVYRWSYKAQCSTYSWGTNDHAGPVSERHIRVILKAPTDGAITYALLALF